jgi:subtilisin family serine protease
VQADSEQALIDGYLTKNLDSVAYAEHDFRVHLDATVVHASGSSVTMANNWGPISIHADSLWQQNQRGDGVVVAVVDTGADLRHPQLSTQFYINPGESGSDANGNDRASNGIDDDGNGYVDDSVGYNFTSGQRGPLTGDDNGHGTHVSGIIAAAHHDTTAKAETYVQGVAPGAKILPLKFLDANGSGSLSDSVAAIQYAVAHCARVINASWGGPDCSRTLRDEIAALASKDVAFIAAAGNDAVDLSLSPEYPAALDLSSQITVGAVGDHGDMADYSNYGDPVHIFAPGTMIASTWPGGQMAYLSGTSMATPFVSGAVALLRAVMPTATVAQIRQALYSSAVHEDMYLNASKGRMDLAPAVSYLHQFAGQ